MFTYCTEPKDYGFRVNARLKAQYLMGSEGTGMAVCTDPRKKHLSILNDCIM